MRLLLPALAAFLLFGCIPGDLPRNQIAVEDFYFTPPVIIGEATDPQRDTVTFTFNWIQPSTGHTIVWDSVTTTGGVPIPPLPDNQEVTFMGSRKVTLTPGTYYYHCDLHQASYGMAGEIIVNPYGTTQSPGAMGSTAPY
jgi:hypothetical protein